jgi:pimeloyl-ACP methyl ester carboxylesterase
LERRRRRFARYRGPVLVVWGRHDRFVPVRATARVPAVYPQAEVAILDGSAHLPMVEEPRTVGALVRAFLRDER